MDSNFVYKTLIPCGIIIFLFLCALSEPSKEEKIKIEKELHEKKMKEKFKTQIEDVKQTMGWENHLEGSGRGSRWIDYDQDAYDIVKSAKLSLRSQETYKQINVEWQWALQDAMHVSQKDLSVSIQRLEKLTNRLADTAKDTSVCNRYISSYIKSSYQDTIDAFELIRYGKTK